MASHLSSSAPILELVYNHIVLPRKLPSRYDGRLSTKVEEDLTARLIDAARVIGERSAKSSHQWERTRRVLQSCKDINAGGRVNKSILLRELRCLEKDYCLIVHIVEQNAALLIRRYQDSPDDHVVFEAFEASPQSESVLAANNSLSWDFPGSAIAIPVSTFSDPGFQENLADFLERASIESVKRFAARAWKAGHSTVEERDTGDPALVTQMLMTLLEVNGHRTYPVLSRKHVRDDVCWMDGAIKPWRRCPLWLVLRVGIQRHFTSTLGGEQGNCVYKFLLSILHARLLEDALHEMSPESLFFLKAKLCRRLVKLQQDTCHAPPAVKTVYRQLFETLEPVFLKITQETRRHVEQIWSNYKMSIQRPISVLPRSAGLRDLYLTLPNSGRYLESILKQATFQSKGPRHTPVHQLPRKSSFPTIAHRLDTFNQCYSALAQLEAAIEDDAEAVISPTIASKEGCIKYAEKISRYLSAVSGSYDGASEQKSIMLLTVMELWMVMDQFACEEFSLLAEFSPGFPTGILDVVQLSRLRDMERLQKIQNYLLARHARCGDLGIFDDPMPGCIAERMYDSTSRLRELHRQIEADATNAQTLKVEEWRTFSAEYDQLMRTASGMAHIYTTQQYSLAQVHARDCPKCDVDNTAARMRIKKHEHPLPTNSVVTKAAVFELQIPAAFAAYRDATWRIISALGHAKLVEGFQSKVLITDYSELKKFRNSSTPTLTLASTTKSFLFTHYSHLKFPVPLDEVCLPNGLKLGYFDTISKVWPSRVQQRWPNFAHHCRVDNTCSTISSMLSSLAFSPDHNGPSSYEVLASQTKCPQGMNVHEYMAFQALFSGRHRRWLVILNELGSSNLNFSTEATYTVISHLALQAGPPRDRDSLRTVHTIFSDTVFCKRLMEQLERRLIDLKNNYRESYSLGIILSILLRLCALVKDPPTLKACEGLLEEARAITHRWVKLLRSEIQKAVDPKTSNNCSQYAIWAALLCRHTYSIQSTTQTSFQAESLRFFIECSIALQENVVGDPSTFSVSLKNALIRDAKMIHRIRFTLRRALETHPESLMLAVKTVWPEPEGGQGRRFSSQPVFAPSPNDWWFESIIEPTNQTAQQILQYHVLTGQLLIDRAQVGRLPAEYRKSVVLTELFGAQSLLTVPSSLSGMSFTICVSMFGHQIHLGQRDGKTVVRACVRDTILELIPRDVLYSQNSFDLPASLVRGCVHWLDLRTGVMEIRKVPQFWKEKDSNWRIDIHNRLGMRRTVNLVDPQSRTFHHIAGIFNQFEYPKELTVFQPKFRPLSVELRRLELSFFVNKDRNLESAHLKSFIDPNQDAGTWYGLNSKLCLRDTTNFRKRSVIVPFGDMTVTRHQMHVKLQINNSGQYARFPINEVLGRIESSLEPRILYFKAQLHAFSSFVLPDPLTGRTGTEEALSWLRLGFCQPWTALNPINFPSLPLIASLTPKRHYYPQDLRAMQKVEWNDKLTTTIQHDAFREVVEEISQKSEQMSTFATIKHALPPLVPLGDRHLLARSISRYTLYERPSLVSVPTQSTDDTPYQARDRFKANQGYQNVYESVDLIRKWAPNLGLTTDLAGILQNFPFIGGHNRCFDKISLTDQLSISFGPEWGPLVELCKTCDKANIFRAQFLFAVMAFGADVDMDLVRVLISFAILEDLKKSIQPPMWESYSHFRLDQVPHVKYLTQMMKSCCLSFNDDVLSELKFNLSSKQRKKLELAEIAHEQRCENDCLVFAQFLFSQWPCLDISLDGAPDKLLVEIPRSMEIISPEWGRLFCNMQLSSYLHLVQDVLNRFRTDRTVQSSQLATPSERLFPIRMPTEPRCFLQNLLCNSGPSLPPKPKFGLGATSFSTYSKSGASVDARAVSHEMQELGNIIRNLQEPVFGLQTSTVRERYAQDLMQSLDALKVFRIIKQYRALPFQPGTIADRITDARLAMDDNFRRLRMAFEREIPGAQWLHEGGLWPCVNSLALLDHLRPGRAKFGDRMKECLVTCAISITNLQRLLRMEEAYLKNNTQGLSEEEENGGYSNWDPLSYTEWLLLQIDSDFLIRPGQVDVALATISPSSGSNSVLQMNMGQGKTSCIIPMVAAILADKKQLLRVIVPKALLLQTAQTLQARLGGLLDREVRHVPFSRKTPTEHDTVKLYGKMHMDIMQSSGLMLCLPEHILSFRLSGIQRLSDGRQNEAKNMVKIDAWMRQVSRDVLDESDVTLAVRTQLIYPSGSQNTVDGHPHRWEIAETLLGLIEGHLWSLQERFPRGIEVHRRPGGGFPVIYLLRKDAEEGLITCLLNDICSGRISALPTRDCSRSDRLVVRQFLSQPKVRHGISERVDNMFPDQPAPRRVLHLLRGLLVHRILLLCLKKRWNVQYGLHPDRDPIAVPFHAKGVPSEQAEWGHPDVAILFTCLAFYYDGINREQLHLSLGHLLKSDDPLCEYERWTASLDNFPDSLREWNAINVDDDNQISEIWQHVRYNVVVIDYFLNNFVFPKHAKQFRVKLQASGWDIPLLPSRETKSTTTTSKRLTTGFSGTNDNRTMLPLTIEQADLTALSHTNAHVLTHLLQRRNRQVVIAVTPRGHRLTETDLLHRLKFRGIRILIDAGAQILEMDNLQLVKAWLAVDGEAPAAVYFDAENKPMVHYRFGHMVPLSVSPFAGDLADCLVYLDQAHCRGTDLKLPIHARGALTLGQDLAKDTAVQAAMRLRQLATTQSVTFFAPLEVHQSILDVCKKQVGDTIDSSHVVRWLLDQTCSGIEQLQPLYYAQGTDFCRRTQAVCDNAEFISDESHREAYLRVLRQNEQQTLEQLYKPRTQVKPSKTTTVFSQGMAAYMKELNTRRKGFQDHGNAVNGSTLQEVEQEREVAHEVEAVREVQRPTHYLPMSFPGLHRDIESFVRTGRLAAGSAGYELALDALARTGLGIKHAISLGSIASKLYVSSEVRRTIQLVQGRPNDSFLRPIQWLLWSTNGDTAIAVIPEEAELAMSILHDLPSINKLTPTHLLTYSAPITRRMLHFNSLDYYGFPPMPKSWKAPTWLTIELGLFAGRLYFEFKEYGELLEFLGLPTAEQEAFKAASTGLDGTEEDVDGSLKETSVAEETQKKAVAKPRLSLSFLQEWLAVRRKGQDFMHTPMGYVCQGKPLKESHPFFAKITELGSAAAVKYQPTRSNHPTSSSAEVQDEVDDFAYEGDFLEDEVVEMEEDAGETEDSEESGTSEDTSDS